MRKENMENRPKAQKYRNFNRFTLARSIRR